MGRKLGVSGRTASSATAQGRMILLSPDAVEDVERLRTFLDQTNSGAARRALALIWAAIERLQEFPALGMQTEDADVRGSPRRAPPRLPGLALIDRGSAAD